MCWISNKSLLAAVSGDTGCVDTDGSAVNDDAGGGNGCSLYSTSPIMCAANYDDFFSEAVALIDTTCEEFIPPEG